MAIGDEAGTKAVQMLNDITIPKLIAAIQNLVDSLDKHVDEDLAGVFVQLNQLRVDLTTDLHGLIDRISINPRS